MLGLLFIYFLGNLGYKLADRYRKNKWLFAFLSIGVYYAGIFTFAVLYGFLRALTGNDLPEDWQPGLMENLVFIALGAATCYGVYKLFERKWQKESLDSPILEIDSIGEHSES